MGYQELGENGYLLLAERLRDPNERALVQKAIEDIMRVKVCTGLKQYGFTLHAILKPDPNQQGLTLHGMNNLTK